MCTVSKKSKGFEDDQTKVSVIECLLITTGILGKFFPFTDTSICTWGVSVCQANKNGKLDKFS